MNQVDGSVQVIFAVCIVIASSFDDNPISFLIDAQDFYSPLCVCVSHCVIRALSICLVADLPCHSFSHGTARNGVGGRSHWWRVGLPS